MKRIDFSVSNSASTVDIMADVDVSLEFADSKDHVDVCSVINDAILSHPTGKRVVLSQGRYNIRLLCVVTRDESGEHATVMDSLQLKAEQI